jgi:hypothetical protein
MRDVAVWTACFLCRASSNSPLDLTGNASVWLGYDMACLRQLSCIELRKSLQSAGCIHDFNYVPLPSALAGPRRSRGHTGRGDISFMGRLKEVSAFPFQLMRWKA